MPKRQPSKVVREPVQVYLDAPDRDTLEQAALISGLPRAEVLRRGLRQYAAELLADQSPALSFLDTAASAAPADVPPDIAERHDDYLADSEIASWTTAAPIKKAKRKVT
jgi:hypothetical protein